MCLIKILGLVGMAKETGGRSFLNGVRARKISAQIRRDFACVYLLSFDAEGLPLDRNLTVGLRTSRKKVKTQVRGRHEDTGRGGVNTANPDLAAIRQD